MTFVNAVILLDVIVLVVIALDFMLVRRTSPSVVATPPAILILVAFVAIAFRVPDRLMEFVAIGLVVIGTALFGYANFLAFTKRGITFSILHNHAKPLPARRRDSDFIALLERMEEMRGRGWAERDAAKWWLNARGQQVVRVRRTVLRLLRIETVG